MSCPSGGCTGGSFAALFDEAAQPCLNCEVTEHKANDAPVLRRVEAPSGIPVRIESVPPQLAGGPRYMKIRNQGKSNLVTAIFSFTYRAANGDKHTTLVDIDSWHLDQGFAQPGTTADVTVMQGIAHPAGIVSVTVRPVYAEFEDGTRFGNGGVSCFQDVRQKKLEVMRNALSQIQEAGNTRESVLMVINEHPELLWLSTVLEKGGIAAVTDRLAAPRKLQL
jgi:hypothetical protein